MKKILTVMLVLMSLTLVGCSKKVPDITNENYKEVQEKLQKKGFYIEPTYVYSDDIDEGNIISQSAEPGSVLENTNIFNVTVSVGSEPYLIPDLKLVDLDLAKYYMDNIKSQHPKFEYAIKYIDSELKKDTVISIEPNGATTDYTPVIISVSNGLLNKDSTTTS